jgi:hypothetical protein
MSNLNNINDTLFGSIGRDYCLWFYFLSLFAFIALVIYLIPAIYLGITQRKGADYYFSVFGISVVYGVAYLQNRILHTMCLNSIRT